jgi:hypothetical protein
VASVVGVAGSLVSPCGMEGITSGAVVVLVSGSVRDAIVFAMLIDCIVLKTSNGPVVLLECVYVNGVGNGFARFCQNLVDMKSDLTSSGAKSEAQSPEAR